MNIKNKIQQLKKSGVRLTEIANATGYSNGYVSKVYREHIDPAPKFRSAFKTFLLEKERPKSEVHSLSYVTPELRKLVYDIEDKISELDNVINQTKSRIDEIKTIVGEQEQAKVNN
jgi:hypothetical protein